MFFIFSEVLSSLGFEFAASVFICVVDYFKLSGVDVEDCSSEDVFELDTGILASFEEDSFVFDVVLNDGGCTISMFLSLMK